MVAYILTVLVAFVIIYAFVKGCNINVNISVKQEFSPEDRQLLEDLYNEKGDMKDRELDMLETLDGAIREINNIMTGTEEESDG